MINFGALGVKDMYLGTLRVTQVYFGAVPLFTPARMSTPADVDAGDDLDYPVTLDAPSNVATVIEFVTGDASDTATEGEDYVIDPQHNP